ncbi:hypothetical protein EJ04DRAFT_488916 [Polyplosphaeria fusca]|uniref:Uncharacterized protein n=1 Tax=Polyplosphaeria fusca TaxID=682080 RepID=A0A9P4R5N8_9PLEO|nr:hypothetical protein EJ04DRAFT_488916 [Polyplosphaeria fusca]
MSEVQAEYVFQGHWVDLSKGRIMGGTITTTTQNGSLVIALLAVLTSIATTHIWHLLAFAYYMVRANGKPSDGLFRQQQAILRTLPTPTSLLADSVKLWWIWKGHADRAFVRSLLVPLVACVFAVGTLAAGIFSSLIVDTSDINVLVKSPYCGSVVVGEVNGTSGFPRYMANYEKFATSYGVDCYENQTILPAKCKGFVRPTIHFSTERTPCPFDTSMCLMGSARDAAVSFDSGLLDLDTVFGMNLKSEDGVQYRKRTTCAPLDIDSRTRLMDPADCLSCLNRGPYPEEQMEAFFVGTYPGDGEWPNITMVQSLLESNMSTDIMIHSTISYADPDVPEPQFTPLKEMKRTDADIVLIKMAKNSVAHAKPNNDPVFSAHKPSDGLDPLTFEDSTVYLSDKTVSIIGCTEQYQFCLTRGSEKSCTNLTGLPSDFTRAFPSASDIQSAALDVLFASSSMMDISNPLSLNISSMKSTTGVIPPIPDDQWVNELHRYESIVFAGIQYVTSNYAIGPKSKDPMADSYTRPPATEGQKALCGMQKMKRSGGFASINVFGLAFVTAIACFSIFLDLIVLRFLMFLTYFRHILAPRIDRWIQDSILQLQRHAYEAEGQGHWTRLNSDMPVATNREAFTDLPLEPLLLRIGTAGTWQTLPSPVTKSSGSNMEKIELVRTKSSGRSHEESRRDEEGEEDPEVLAAWNTDTVPYYRQREYIHREH